MRLDYHSDTLKFENNREGVVMRMALENYKHYLEAEVANDSVNSKLKTLTDMLDEFQFQDDVTEG